MNYIIEATRRELINKSKNAEKVKSYGTTRYDRRKFQSINNPQRDLNKIDFNALFKADTLKFNVNVRGEHGKYKVVLLFDNICKQFKREIKSNNNVLEYKCIYRALVKVINREDIYISCTCGDFKYRMSFWATQGDYNSGQPETRLAEITNPDDSKGAGCKHIMLVLSRMDLINNLATSIFNYICYIEQEYPSKFEKIIFPKLFDISYDEYMANTEVEILDDDEIEDSEEEESEEEIEEPEETPEEE